MFSENGNSLYMFIYVKKFTNTYKQHNFGQCWHERPVTRHLARDLLAVYNSCNACEDYFGGRDALCSSITQQATISHLISPDC